MLFYIKSNELLRKNTDYFRIICRIKKIILTFAAQKTKKRYFDEHTKRYYPTERYSSTAGTGAEVRRRMCL